MAVPKLGDFTPKQQAEFVEVAKRREKNGEKVDVSDVIKEYYNRDQLEQSAKKAVKH